LWCLSEPDSKALKVGKIPSSEKSRWQKVVDVIIIVSSKASSEERFQLTSLLRRLTSNKEPIVMTKIEGHEVIVLDQSQLDAQAKSAISQQSAVERVVQLSTPYKLVSKAFKTEGCTISVDGNKKSSQPVKFGDSSDPPVIIAGPCSIESREQLLSIARLVKAAGAQILRGGAFKPRTSPYQFQGLGVEGLQLLAEGRQITGLPVITEVMEPGMVETVAQYADILQIGSRNMQNTPLLIAVGHNSYRRPVVLKRGLAATIDEWLLAAEYIVAAGNPNVILCERGILSFDPQTRNLLDLTCVPLLHELTYLPVIVDPSHGTGRRGLVQTMSRAAIAAGADGLMLEVHIDPDSALSDGHQSITPEQLKAIVNETKIINQVLREKHIFHG
jgi:3-deoxy-7-phosphoheptulonate synthase